MSMKNPREVAIKILENAKKALKEKMESLEKAEGKNTAQLNEFKGIPQPPAPKAPEKAIAPTPTIPQPKMPSLGKPSRPLGSFMKSRMDKANLNKARVDEGKTIKEKQEARESRHWRTPHWVGSDPKAKIPSEILHENYTNKEGQLRGMKRRHDGNPKWDPANSASNKEIGLSIADTEKGVHHRGEYLEGAKSTHKKKLAEIKAMPKPSLPKSEEMNKAKIYDIKSKKMIADHGQPEKTTPPKGNLKLVGSAPTKAQPKAPVKKQPKSAK